MPIMPTIAVSAITDPKEFEALENELKPFFDLYSNNPFLLLPFLKKIVQFLPKGTAPLFLIARAQGRIIGVAPFMLNQKFAYRSSNFLLKCELSPDFIVNDAFRDLFLESVLAVAFKKLRVQSLILDIPHASPNREVIERICSKNSFALSKQPNSDSKNHSVIYTGGSWENFQQTMGSRYRKRFRKIEKTIQDEGQYRILSFVGKENPDKLDYIYDSILEVERLSWKQTWRSQHSQEYDDDLMWLWQSSVSAQEDPAFQWLVHFLELNSQVIAYVFAINYKGTTYIGKTSFVDKYRSLHPGLFLMNSALKFAMNTAGIYKIDFLTNLDFFKIWRPSCEVRTTVAVNCLIPRLLQNTQNKCQLVYSKFQKLIA